MCTMPPHPGTRELLQDVPLHSKDREALGPGPVPWRSHTPPTSEADSCWEQIDRSIVSGRNAQGSPKTGLTEQLF